MRGRVRIEIKLLDQTLRIDAPTPPVPARLDDLLPLMYAIDDAAIEQTIARAECEGRSVSCRKGCSACCRAQPVPVTPPEALALTRLVESMPKIRQGEVRARFADRVQRLRQAGLSDAFMTRDENMGPPQARELAHRYFALGLVCPFLDGDACSIHPQRPFVCRQYLVSSPASLCADPFTNPVAVLQTPLAAATAMLATADSAYGRPQHTVPLVLALEYADGHRAELERAFDGEPLMRQWLRAIARLAQGDYGSGTASRTF